MRELKEIMSISNYKPQNGDKLWLYTLIEQGESRDSAQDAFKEKGKSNAHFRVVLKKIKDELLDGIAQYDFKDYPEDLRTRIKLIRKRTDVITLLRTEHKNAASILAREIIGRLEKYHMIEEALSIYREMSITAAMTGDSKLKEYNAKVTLYMRALQEEVEANMLYTVVSASLRKGRSLKEYYPQLRKLETYLKHNRFYRFRHFYYVTALQIYQVKKDAVSILAICNQATKFFEGISCPLPYTTRLAFEMAKIPVYISLYDFTRAELALNKCIDLPEHGSHNKHLILMYKTQLGFYSEKPNIAYLAFRESEVAPLLHESLQIKMRWQSIFIYLKMYENIGRLHIALDDVELEPSDFSGMVAQTIYFLQSNQKDKAKIILVKMEELKPSKRGIVFRQLLEAYVNEDDTKKAVDAAMVYRRQLKEMKVGYDLHQMFEEIVPYEVLFKDLVNYNPDKKK